MMHQEKPNTEHYLAHQRICHQCSCDLQIENIELDPQTQLHVIACPSCNTYHHVSAPAPVKHRHAIKLGAFLIGLLMTLYILILTLAPISFIAMFQYNIGHRWQYSQRDMFDIEKQNSEMIYEQFTNEASNRADEIKAYQTLLKKHPDDSVFKNKLTSLYKERNQYIVIREQLTQFDGHLMDNMYQLPPDLLKHYLDKLNLNDASNTTQTNTEFESYLRSSSLPIGVTAIIITFLLPLISGHLSKVKLIGILLIQMMLGSAIAGYHLYQYNAMVLENVKSLPPDQSMQYYLQALDWGEISGGLLYLSVIYLIAGIVTIFATRPIARLLISKLIPSHHLPKFQNLWLTDGKALPGFQSSILTQCPSQL